MRDEFRAPETDETQSEMIRTDPNPELLMKLQSRAQERKLPLRVMFEVTYRCNFHCRHCYVPDSYKEKVKELGTARCLSIIDQLADAGCFYLGFTGGEPFMRKDLLELVSHAVKRGMQVIINSNGSLIDAAKARRLARLGVNKVDITVPALDAKTFEAITLAPGSHAKVFRAIRSLKQAGVPLGLKSCVLKENQSQIEAIAQFARRNKALYRLDDLLSPRLDGDKGPFEYRGRLPQANGAGKVASGAGDTLFRCGSGFTQAAVTPQGKLKFCLMIDYPGYRLTPGSFQRHWKRLNRLAEKIQRQESSSCRQCDLSEYCHWCPARAWLLDKSFGSCDSECRKQAQERFKASAVRVRAGRPVRRTATR
jgi:radical SAM protein with 4Fe4S-binding SPASM domain